VGADVLCFSFNLLDPLLFFVQFVSLVGAENKKGHFTLFLYLLLHSHGKGKKKRGKLRGVSDHVALWIVLLGCGDHFVMTVINGIEECVYM